MYETFGQGYAFAFMAVSGLVMGAWFHACMFLEKRMRAGRALTGVTDAVCALGLFVVLLFSMFFTVRLEARLYPLFAAFIGMAVYMCIVAPALRAIVYFAIKKICSLYRFHNLKKICQIFCR